MSPLSDRSHSPLRTFVLAVLLLAAAGITYHRVGGYDLLTWDDRANLTQNPYLNPPTFDNIAVFWQKPYAHLYIPLTYTFWLLEANVAQQPDEEHDLVRYDPGVFHYGNLVLHLCCVLAVFGILLRLVRHDFGAFFGALLFGLHPLQAEAVSWVSETKGLLAALFSFAAIWLYLAYTGVWAVEGIEPDEPRDAKPAWRRGVYYVLGTVALILALLCKPSAVAVVPIVVVVDLWLLRRRVVQVAGATVLWLGVAMGAVGVTIWAQGASASEVVVAHWARPLVAGDALAFYLFKLGAPLNLGPDYARTPYFVMEHWWFYLTWIFPALAVVWLARLDGRRIWLSAAGIFVAGVLPVLGFTPFEYQNISTVADRYVYLSMLGPALAAAYLVRINLDRATLVVGIVLAGLLGYASFAQSGIWTDDYELFSHNLTVTPQSPVSHVKVGNVLFAASRRGKDEDLNLRYLEEAQNHFRAATELNPDGHRAYYNLGSTLLRLEQPEEAAECYRQVIRLRPNMAGAHFSLGVALGKTNQYVEARREFLETLRLDPKHTAAKQSMEQFEQVLDPLP